MRAWLVVCFCLSVISDLVAGVEIHVRTTETVRPLRHFWKSTGFCPPLLHTDVATFDLSQDMQYNIAILRAIPRSGNKLVHIHWLLDLVTVTSLPLLKPRDLQLHQPGLTDRSPVHQWSEPGFELMGNPSGLFRDFEDKTSLMMWKDLVTQTAQRYIHQYGVGRVTQWNFETWKEPDCHDFDDVNMTVQGFLNYYDACSEGLKAASRIFCWVARVTVALVPFFSDALLRHVVNGTNYFTGETGIRLDFLSYHKKAMLGRHLTPMQEAQFLLNNARLFITYNSLAFITGVSPDSQVIGFYKVRALNYFGQYSEYSLSQQYPSTGKVIRGYHGNRCQGL